MAKKGLNPKALGLAMGVLCAVAMVILSLWVLLFGVGAAFIELTSKFYFGYSTSFLGILLGAVYGFIDGFVGGWVIASLYNKFS